MGRGRWQKRYKNRGGGGGRAGNIPKKVAIIFWNIPEKVAENVGFDLYVILI